MKTIIRGIISSSLYLHETSTKFIVSPQNYQNFNKKVNILLKSGNLVKSISDGINLYNHTNYFEKAKKHLIVAQDTWQAYNYLNNLYSPIYSRALGNSTKKQKNETSAVEESQVTYDSRSTFKQLKSNIIDLKKIKQAANFFINHAEFVLLLNDYNLLKFTYIATSIGSTSVLFSSLRTAVKLSYIVSSTLSITSLTKDLQNTELKRTNPLDKNLMYLDIGIHALAVLRLGLPFVVTLNPVVGISLAILANSMGLISMYAKSN